MIPTVHFSKRTMTAAFGLDNSHKTVVPYG